MEDSKLLNDYLKKEKEPKKRNWLTKILVCMILILSSLIFTSLSDDNLVLFKKYVFEDTFDFMGFKNLYSKLAGDFSNKEETSQNVMAGDIEYSEITKYQDGQSLSISKDVPISVLNGGIVIFIGQKDGYNNTVIIQGSDGFDIWYGNVENIDVKMYDYVDTNQIIASASDNLYLVITKDSKYYTYEEYRNKA